MMTSELIAKLQQYVHTYGDEEVHVEIDVDFGGVIRVPVKDVSGSMVDGTKIVTVISG